MESMDTVERMDFNIVGLSPKKLNMPCEYEQSDSQAACTVVSLKALSKEKRPENKHFSSSGNP